MDARLAEIKKRLIEITKDCQGDMHEPDNQGISAVVVGDHLGNAMGNRVIEGADSQEFVVGLHNMDTETSERFNLADLIALARA